MKINVTYMSGAGNLFSVIDNRELGLSIQDGEKLAPILCKTKEFDTEGLMFLNVSDDLSFECEFFNPDGSTGMMCGNGGRAITRFAQMNGIEILENSKFLMAGDIYNVSLNGDNIKLVLPAPKVLPKKIKVPIVRTSHELSSSKEIKEFETVYSNTGTHHLMIDYSKYWKDDFRGFEIEGLAKPFRHHELFKPDGVNVNFYEIENDKVQLRTFEKGVEFETGACGTGAVATALTVAKLSSPDNGMSELREDMGFPIKLIPPSGEELKVDVIKENGTIVNTILEGPAKKISEDIIEIEL